MADSNIFDFGLDSTKINKQIKNLAVDIKKAFAKIPDIEIGAKLDSTKLKADAKKTAKTVKTTFEKTKPDISKNFAKEFTQIKTDSKQAAKKLETNFEKAGRDASIGFKKGFDIKSALIGAGGLALITQGLRSVVNGLKSAVQSTTEFEASIADLSAITGLQGAALDGFGDSARDLAKEFGTDVITQVESFKAVISRFGPDIAGTPEAVESMSNSINVLAKAAGLDATESMDALTTAVLQYGVDLSDPIKASEEMARFMNVLAAASKEGAAEVPELKDAIGIAGKIAKDSNISFEELASGLEVLALANLRGAEAGTKFRGVIGRIAKVTPQATKLLAKYGVNVGEVQKAIGEEGLSSGLRIMKDRLDEIKDPMELQNVLFTVFGTTNAVAAKSLLDNVDTMDEYTKRLTGTNTAIEQAATKMESFDEVLARMKSNVADAGLSLGQALIPVLSKLATEIVPLFEKIVKKALPPFIEIIEDLAPLFFDVFGVIADTVGVAFAVIAPIISNFVKALIVLKPLLIGAAIGFGVFTVATAAASVSMTALTAVIAANPFGAALVGVIALTTGIIALVDAFTTTSEEALELANAEHELIQTKIDLNKESQDVIKSNIKISDSFRRTGVAAKKSAKDQDELTTSTALLALEYPDVVKVTASYEDNLKALNKELGIQDEATSTLTEKQSDLIDEYDNLIAKEQLTTEEKKRLTSVTNELKSEFPDLIKTTGDFSDAVILMKDKVFEGSTALNDMRKAVNDLESDMGRVTARELVLGFESGFDKIIGLIESQFGTDFSLLEKAGIKTSEIKELAIALETQLAGITDKVDIDRLIREFSDKLAKKDFIDSDTETEILAQLRKVGELRKEQLGTKALINELKLIDKVLKKGGDALILYAKNLNDPAKAIDLLKRRLKSLTKDGEAESDEFIKLTKVITEYEDTLKKTDKPVEDLSKSTKKATKSLSDLKKQLAELIVANDIKAVDNFESKFSKLEKTFLGVKKQTDAVKKANDGLTAKYKDYSKDIEKYVIGANKRILASQQNITEKATQRNIDTLNAQRDVLLSIFDGIDLTAPEVDFKALSEKFDANNKELLANDKTFNAQVLQNTTDRLNKESQASKKAILDELSTSLGVNTKIVQQRNDAGDLINEYKVEGSNLTADEILRIETKLSEDIFAVDNTLLSDKATANQKFRDNELTAEEEEKNRKIEFDKEVKDNKAALDQQTYQNTINNAKQLNDILAKGAEQIFGESKGIAIAQSIINTALGVTYALSTLNYVGAALIALEGAVQLGVITAAQPKGAEEGVIGLTKSYNKKAGKTDSISMMLAPSESVITKKGTLAQGKLFSNKEALEYANKGLPIEKLFMSKMSINPQGKLTQKYVNNKDTIQSIISNKELVKSLIQHKEVVRLVTPNVMNYVPKQDMNTPILKSMQKDISELNAKFEHTSLINATQNYNVKSETKVINEIKNENYL